MTDHTHDSEKDGATAHGATQHVTDETQERRLVNNDNAGSYTDVDLDDADADEEGVVDDEADGKYTDVDVDSEHGSTSTGGL
jgi:hypothetical protein